MDPDFFLRILNGSEIAAEYPAGLTKSERFAIVVVRGGAAW
jgi:hypothetical protein